MISQIPTENFEDMQNSNQDKRNSQSNNQASNSSSNNSNSSSTSSGQSGDNSNSKTTNPTIENLLSDYYDVTANIESGRGYSELVKLNDFYLYLNEYSSQPYATLGIVNNTETNNIQNNQNSGSNLDIQSKSLVSLSNNLNVETIGLAVFKNDKFVGTLTANETLCHEILIDNLNYCTINIPSPFNNNESIDLQLSSLKKPNIKVRISNTSPFVETKIYVTAKILSFNSNDDNSLTEDKLNIIRENTIKYMEQQYQDYFNKVSKELNCDIAGIGKHAAKNFSKISDWENYNWPENFRNCTFKTDIILSVKSGHLLTNE